MSSRALDADHADPRRRREGRRSAHQGHVRSGIAGGRRDRVSHLSAGAVRARIGPDRSLRPSARPSTTIFGRGVDLRRPRVSRIRPVRQRSPPRSARAPRAVPGPMSPEASGPDSGSTMRTPRARRRATLSCVAAFCHMCVSMAGRDDDRRPRREDGGRDEVIREPRRQPRDDVRGRRRDHHDVGLPAHRDVPRRALVLDLEHLDLDRAVRERLERERAHELRRGPAHDDLHRGAALHQSARELDRFVGSDRAGHAEDDEAALKLPAHAFSSYRSRRPSSVRSSSTLSMPFASGAIVAASPPVAMTRGFAGSSARIRSRRPSTRPT